MINDINYPFDSKVSDRLKIHADVTWTDDCFVAFSRAVLTMINDYYISVRGLGYGVAGSLDYTINFAPWSVSIDETNQTIFTNGGRMLGVVIRHNESKRALKIDLSSFVDTIVFTTFLKLTLNKDNIVVLKDSFPVFQGANNFYNFNTQEFLSKIYNFLEFGITDIELNQNLATVH